MAEQHQGVEIPRGLEVSMLGFGCLGLSAFYNDPVPDEVGISIIKHAFARGITFFDTSDIYGPQTNEILVGKALKQLPLEKVQLATKFGVIKMDPAAGAVINGTPEYVRASIEASLKRLDVDYIDLYYQHRVDTKTPIEDTQIGGREIKVNITEKPLPQVDLSLLQAEDFQFVDSPHKVYVGNLAKTVTLETLKKFFSEKGKVMSNIPVNLRTYTKMLKQSRSLLSRSLQSAKWGDGFESRAAFSTSLQDFAAIGNANVRVFAPYTIYKGKASLSISPVLPTFVKMDSDIDGLKVNRRGSMMLTFCPAIGERKYDWEKRQYKSNAKRGENVPNHQSRQGVVVQTRV